MLKIELGGGKRARGDGFVNVDICDGADVRCDLDRDRLPFEDGSVDEVYSSHCLEHLSNPYHLLHEVARVCREGARVEVRVPHWLSQMALCAGHHCTVSPLQVQHWTQDFVADWWAGSPRRLKLVSTEYVPSASFGRLRELYSWWPEEDVLKFAPDATHEIRFGFEVIRND